MKALKPRPIWTGWLALSVLLLTACSGSRLIVSEWRNPAYVAPAFKVVMVGGLSEQTSIRRNFEDELVAQLRAAGVQAIPSYRHIPESDKLDGAKLKETAQKSGADAVLSARPISIEQKTEIGPSFYPVPSIGIFGSNIGGVWHGPSGAPRVTRITEYTSETTLYDLQKDEIVWSATIKTSEPENVETAIKAYVKAVVQSLKEKDLLATQNDRSR